MDNRPIGIFDSGLGGLTALTALQELLPRENIVYFADGARVPYGGRRASQLRKMAVQDLGLLASFQPKAIIVACGTLSSTAPDILEGYPLPVFGVVRPALRALCAMPGDGPIGVIATEASIRSGAYKRGLLEARGELEVIDLPCPKFVPLIESGHTDREDPLLRAAVESALAPLKMVGVSALLLGCTHYGLIADAIRDFLGDGVELVSASGCAARELTDYLRENELEGGDGDVRFFTSGSAPDFRRAASVLLRLDSLSVGHVPMAEVADDDG